MKQPDMAERLAEALRSIKETAGELTRQLATTHPLNVPERIGHLLSISADIHAKAHEALAVYRASKEAK